MNTVQDGHSGHYHQQRTWLGLGPETIIVRAFSHIHLSISGLFWTGGSVLSDFHAADLAAGFQSDSSFDLLCLDSVVFELTTTILVCGLWLKVPTL